MFGFNKTVKQLGVQVSDLSQQLKTQREDFEIKIEQEKDLTVKASKEAFAAAFRQITAQIFPNYTTASHSNAFQTLDDLYSVVSRIAMTAALIPFYAEGKDGSEVKDTDKLYTFINSLSLEKKYEMYLFILLQGEYIGYKDKIDFGVNAGLNRLVSLHPGNVSVFITKSFPYDVVGYRYYDNISGEMNDYLKEEVFHVKLFNPDIDVNLQVRGLPPVKVLAQRLTRVKAGLDVSVAQMQNGGLPGVLFPKVPGITVETAGQKRDNFGRFLQNKENKGAPYFSADEMGYFEIGSTLADMSLAELSMIDLDKICNVYHVSSTEFNNKNSSTESNVSTHSKSFYTNGVLPIVSLIMDGLNRQVVPEIKTQAKIKEDITDIQELQPNMLSIAQAMAAMPVMRPNDVIEKMGYERDKDELMESWYLKSGYQPLEEATMQIPDVENSAGDYANAGASVVPIKRAANGK